MKPKSKNKTSQVSKIRALREAQRAGGGKALTPEDAVSPAGARSQRMPLFILGKLAFVRQPPTPTLPQREQTNSYSPGLLFLVTYPYAFFC